MLFLNEEYVCSVILTSCLCVLIVMYCFFKKGYSKFRSYFRGPDAVEGVGQLDPSGERNHDLVKCCPCSKEVS